MTLHVALVDGTRNDRRLGTRGDVEAAPTSIAALAGLLADETPAGERQDVAYHPGVGSLADVRGTGWRGLVSALWRAGSGSGVDDLADDVYSGLRARWRDGDRCVLVGFSRGAMVCRLVAHEIQRRGLCPLGETCSRTACRTVSHLAMLDCVSTWGLPDVRLLERSPRLALGAWVLSAWHAVALDEDRRWFPPHLLEPGLHRREVWYPGAHADVGGGWADRRLADVVLLDLLDELAGRGVGVISAARLRLAPDPSAPPRRAPGLWPRRPRTPRRLLDDGPAEIREGGR